MKIYYVSSTMRAQDYSELFSEQSKMTGQQIQKFHRLLIEGFTMNGNAVNVVSCVPINRDNYNKVFYPGKKVRAEKTVYYYLPVINLPVIKNAINMLGTFLKVLFMDSEDVVVCDVLNASVSFAAAAAAKLKKARCVGIVTDLPDMMVSDDDSNSRFVSMVNHVIGNCSHYVFLTEHMNDVLNPHKKPHVVVEGLCDSDMYDAVRGERSELKKCIYAGYLHARYGVKDMVDGFVMAGIPDAELHIYGYGPYSDELMEVCRLHYNVVFHGTVLNDEVVKAELAADLLINPRPTHEEFTKYSFPSKNMEYMASGTAVLTTKLPGMPEEYYPYVYLIEEETAEGIAKALKHVMNLPRAERDTKGVAAKSFVMKHKSNGAQAKKILKFVNCRD